MPGLRGGQRRAHRRVEGRDITDHMVRGQHQQHRIDRAGLRGDALEGGVRRQRDGRRGVAAEGLEDRGARLDRQLPQLLGHQEAVRLVADHHRRGGGEAVQAQHRLLQHRALAGQRQQLLGIKLARQRPQPRTCAAGENDWSDHAWASQAVTSGRPRPMA